MANRKIMIVDDESLIRKLVADFLRKENYMPIEAKDGGEALEKFNTEKEISLIILDVMLPVYDGWEVLKEIRKKSAVPVIMLTAKGEEFDELFGFGMGADEYISKPFSPNILMARINALLRRTVIKGAKLREHGGIIIDEDAHTVVIEGRYLDLSPKEYELLSYLVDNAGKALSREQILDKVWGYDYFGDYRTVDTHVNRLRIKLENKSGYIQTVRGCGYRFEVEA
jgi:DNA-binding response OmpR family regulator